MREHKQCATTVPGTSHLSAGIVPDPVRSFLATAFGNSQRYLDFTARSLCTESEIGPGLYVLQERTNNSNSGLSASQSLLLLQSFQLLLVVSPHLPLPPGGRKGWARLTLWFLPASPCKGAESKLQQQKNRIQCFRFCRMQFLSHVARSISVFRIPIFFFFPAISFQSSQYISQLITPT